MQGISLLTMDATPRVKPGLATCRNDWLEKESGSRLPHSMRSYLRQ
jgi:hypothetical protein